MIQHPCDLAKNILLSFDDNTVSTALSKLVNWGKESGGGVWDAIYERYYENMKSKNPHVFAVARGMGDDDSVKILLLGQQRTNPFMVDFDEDMKNTQGDVRFWNPKALRGCHSRRPPTEVFSGFPENNLIKEKD